MSLSNVPRTSVASESMFKRCVRSAVFSARKVELLDLHPLQLSYGIYFCLSDLHISNCVSITYFSCSGAIANIHVWSVLRYDYRVSASKVVIQMGYLIGFVAGVTESNSAVRRAGVSLGRWQLRLIQARELG